MPSMGVTTTGLFDKIIKTENSPPNKVHKRKKHAPINIFYQDEINNDGTHTPGHSVLQDKTPGRNK